MYSTMGYSMTAGLNPLNDLLRDHKKDSQDTCKLVGKIKELVRGNTIVELGSRDSPLTELFDFEPEKYICVDPSGIKPKMDLPKFVSHVNTDGLSFLTSLQDNSVVVVSTGLFDRAILYDTDYARKLIGAIHQKTKQNGLSLHAIYDRNFKDDFFRSGFSKEFSAGDIFIFRKP